MRQYPDSSARSLRRRGGFLDRNLRPADGHPELIGDAPPPPEPKPLAIERPPRWSEKLIRRTLGRDRENTARLLNRIGYEATMRRIMREGT